VRSEVQIFPGPPTFAADAASVGTPTFEPRRLPAVVSAKAGALTVGAIAQLGERLLCKQEVVGSIPSGSTRRLLEALALGGIAGCPTLPTTNSSFVRNSIRAPSVLCGDAQVV
jgi:hypothetical protein